ncbi:MAG: hypothetical protein WC907_04485 [Acholeplasmataceae bacterium]
MKKKIMILFTIIGMLILVGCDVQINRENIYLEESKDEIKIGIKNLYQFNFSNIDNKWNFNGVSVDGKDLYLFDGMEENAFYRYFPLENNLNNPETMFNDEIDDVVVVTNTEDEKQIQIKNDSVSLFLTMNSDSKYIKREYTFNVETQISLSAYQLGFTLRSNPEMVVREYGSIGTKDPSINTANIPYAFPAIYTKLFTNSKEYNVINVIDFENTSKAFNKIRKRAVQGTFELGVTSDDYDLEIGEYSFVDYWTINNETASYYDLIGEAASQYLKINPIPVDDLSQNYNMNAQTFEVIAKNLFNDLLDERNLDDRLKGSMKPYGYMEDHGGWGEVFALLDATKGMLRYAIAKEDDEKINQTIDLIKRITDDHGPGNSWIFKYDGANAKNDEYFLHHSYDGSRFINNSSGEETGNQTGISGWKYYDLLANLGDLAVISKDQSIIDGFLKLMPFLNTLKLENYGQPVAWYYDSRLPATGYEDGGSAGNASTWAYIHLVASTLSNDNKEYYLSEALNALEFANNSDYYNMTAMRVAVKPVVIGWNVRANLFAYEITNDIKYLDSAKETARGLLSFYYINSNPETFFATIGFGYADLRERWEAYLEMAQSIWLVSPVLEFMYDETPLLDLLYSASKTYPYAFPINGNPYGNYERVPGYDSLDGYYIPFEFTTGVLTDNPGAEGGIQSAYRQVKETYGAGETFLNYLMFEGYGSALNQKLLLLNVSGTFNDFDNSRETFILYNPSLNKESSIVKFIFKKDTNYEVFLNGKSIGTFSKNSLNNGLLLELNERTAVKINIYEVR